MSGALDEYDGRGRCYTPEPGDQVDEYDGGQLGLGVPGEQRSLLPRPIVPMRCAAHDRYHDCPQEVK